VNLRKAFTAIAVGAVLAVGASACGDPAAPPVDAEDCDAEDYANREESCGFMEADRRKPSPKKTTTTRKP
jgi:hypothetical protein